MRVCGVTWGLLVCAETDPDFCLSLMQAWKMGRSKNSSKPSAREKRRATQKQQNMKERAAVAKALKEAGVTNKKAMR